MASPETLRLGSRDSALALVQTNMVAQELHKRFPSLKLEVETFKTQGDKILDTSLALVGGKGLFVKELEEALLDNRIDLAIHSMKDMPADSPSGLALCSVLPREDARDVMLSSDMTRFSDLEPNAVIGTSSLRRETQLKRLRADLKFELIRGNLQTRYRKLFDEPYDAIILAYAGIKRLSWDSRVSHVFDPWTECVPAPAQGILGAQYRETDSRVQDMISKLQYPAVEVSQRAERSVLKGLGASCTTPLGVYCRPGVKGYEMKAILLSPDQKASTIQSELSFGIHDDPVKVGQDLAQELLDKGGQAIIDQLNQAFTQK
jgi:hydroxymethylbilane synthase